MTVLSKSRKPSPSNVLGLVTWRRCLTGVIPGWWTRAITLGTGQVGMPGDNVTRHIFSLADHIVAAQQLPWQRTSALVLLEGHPAVDQDVAYARRFLDKASLITGEVIGINGLVVYIAELLEIVDHNVSPVPQAQRAAIFVVGDPCWISTHLVVCLLQCHELSLANPVSQEVHGPHTASQVADMGPTIRQRDMRIGVRDAPR